MSTDLRAAKVTFKEREAGRLEETAAGGTRFTYHETFTDTIAACLPAARRAHEWISGLHPFFQHLGPEGWLREKQARVGHIAEEDDFGLLLQYGADCIGAVGTLPFDDQPSTAALADEAANPGRTISGVQRKLLVVRDDATSAYRPAGIVGPAPFIAKFNSQTISTLVRNENMSLRWTAAMLGEKEVTAFRVASVAEQDDLALIVTRFDRTADGQKLRAEDFAQILNKPRGADHAGKYDSSYEEVAEVIRTHSVRPQIDLARLFRRLVVFALVANGDAHLKNFTLLERPEGLRLSPVYDVVNVGVYAGQGFSQELALAIGGERVMLDAITPPLLTGFGGRIGLSKATIAGVFRELKARAVKATSGLPNPEEGRDPFGSNYAEIVRNACLRLLEE